MTHRITATDFDGVSCTLEIDILKADHCPVCHEHVTPKVQSYFLDGAGIESRWLQQVCRCPNSACGEVFIANYEAVSQMGSSVPIYFFRNVRPGCPIGPSIPENILAIPSRFAEIYKQASYAEQYGLTEICGGGYRKALEFLVKDFLLSRSESLGLDEEEIKQAFLSKCINEHIEDKMTIRVAKRAAWLGNDEIHYFRKWEDKDIEDLKILLTLTMNAIENQLLAESYEGEMQS